MHDVCTLQLAEELGPVEQLCGDRPQVFDVHGVPEHARRDRVDGHQPCLDVRIALPGSEQTVRLHRLATQDAHASGRRSRPGLALIFGRYASARRVAPSCCIET